MTGKPGQGGPKPAETKPKAPSTSPGQKPEQTPAQKVEAKKEDKETDIVKKTTKDLESLMSGMDLMTTLKSTMEAWGRLWQKLMNLGYEFDNFNKTQDPKKQREIISGWESRIKVPEIKDKSKLKTKIEKPGKDEKLVDYLYKCLNLQKPDPKEIKPETTKVELPHLILQLKKSLAYAEGRPAITEKFTKKKPTFHKGDMVVLRDKNKTGKDDEFTAGFVEAIDKTTVYIRNNKNDEPQKYPAAMLFLAFQIPGNMQNGKAPEYPKEKDDDDKKDKKAS